MSILQGQCTRLPHACIIIVLEAVVEVLIVLITLFVPFSPIEGGAVLVAAARQRTLSERFLLVDLDLGQPGPEHVVPVRPLAVVRGSGGGRAHVVHGIGRRVGEV